MLKTLDRYIIRQFLGTFFYILVLIMAIAVVFDLSEKTEDFARMTATWQEIVVNYYLNFILYYANLFTGLLIFLAVILFTSRLSGRSEVIAVLSSGISFPRLLRPYLIAASFLFCLSLTVNHYVLPSANRTRLNFEEAHLRVAFRIHDHNLHRDLGDGTLAYFESFTAVDRTGFRFSLEQWKGDSVMTYKLLADRAVYDTITGEWHVFDFFERRLTPTGEVIRRGAKLDTLLAMKPADIGQRVENVTSLTTPELDQFIEKEQARGSAVAYARVERHQRTSYPFAAFIFTMIGVSIASRKVRGGTGLHLFFGILLILLYIFSMKMTTVAAINAGFPPMLAVWLPNIVFSVVGIWIYKRAPK